jgi:hypothetical protein
MLGLALVVEEQQLQPLVPVSDDPVVGPSRPRPLPPGDFLGRRVGERLMLRVVADLVMAVLLVAACMPIATGVVALITATIRTKRWRGR